MGLADPRSYGSGNPGATNVLRSGNQRGRGADAGARCAEGLRAGAAGAAARRRASASANTTAAFVGLAAFVGHLWPVFFRFQGGKGVATAAGVLLALEPVLGAGDAARPG